MNGPVRDAHSIALDNCAREGQPVTIVAGAVSKDAIVLVGDSRQVRDQGTVYQSWQSVEKVFSVECYAIGVAGRYDLGSEFVAYLQKSCLPHNDVDAAVTSIEALAKPWFLNKVGQIFGNPQLMHDTSFHLLVCGYTTMGMKRTGCIYLLPSEWNFVRKGPYDTLKFAGNDLCEENVAATLYNKDMTQLQASVMLYRAVQNTVRHDPKFCGLPITVWTLKDGGTAVPDNTPLGPHLSALQSKLDNFWSGI